VSRVYLVNDIRGTRRVEGPQLPLLLGGADVADVVLPGSPADGVAAYIALSDGHAYLQPATADGWLFHNHRRVRESVWLKSGDQVQAGDAVLHWTVRGDQVHIDVSAYQPPLPGQAPVTAVLQPPVSQPPLPEVEPPAHAGKHKALRRAVAAVMALLLLVAGFVLLATPIEINIVPPPTTQQLSGFPPPLPLGKRLLVWPGKYRLRAALAGYRDLDELLDIPMGGFRSFGLNMRELPGEIVLRVQPNVPYRLKVDVAPVDVDTQHVARIERGTRLLRIESERYLPAEQQVDVAGLGKLQQVSFTLVPAWAGVHIDSQPPGAEVHVDGEPLGRTPLDTELLQGEHSITLQMPSYKVLTMEQKVVAGVPLALDGLVLEPADGQVMLESIPDASTVQLDGEYRGTTPTRLTLSSTGEHRLQLSKPGYVTLEQTLRVQPEEQQTLKLKLAAQYGTVFVATVPADAELRVDGEGLGKATRRLRLTTQPHRLEIHKPGYVNQVFDITPRAGVSQNLEVNLKTLQQARQVAVAETVRTGAGQGLRLVRSTQPFTLGASRREPGRRANESARLVQLTRPFYFGEKEVTNAEYRAFQPAHTSGSAEGVSLDGPDQPVVNISWDDAARYCNWLSKQQGLPAAYREVDGHMQLIRPVTNGYRLPTEVEWAYVARVLGRREPARYAWEGNFPPLQVVGNFADARISDTLAQTVPNYDDHFRVSAPVGSFAACPPGFYDLAGNVAEWMTDYYNVYPGQAGQLVKDPIGPASGEHHVVRGSSWRHGNITELRLSYRDYSREPRADLGFRLARYVE
jgi:formylglycine-generating enzyme required for sulfatase activity